MNKSLRLIFAMLMIFGCVSYQHLAVAQTDEQSTDNKVYTLSNAGPVVTLTAKLHPVIIEDVVFEGLQAVPEADVLRAFREKRVGIGKKYLYTTANFEKAKLVIKELLYARGYMTASVDLTVVDVSDHAKILNFKVTEGLPLFVKEIRFEGNRIFSEDELRSQLRHVSASGQEALDTSLLEYDLKNVQGFLRSRGYLQASMLAPRYEVVYGGILVTVSLNEGRLYRIGEIIVLDAQRFSSEQIVRLIGLKKGEVADGKLISDVLFDELKTLYANAGYPQYSVFPKPEFIDSPEAENEGIVNFHIDIDEGSCFKIAWIVFKGNENLTEKELRQFLLFREGDTFDQQAVTDSIKRLNESGLIAPIDSEGDVDFAVNEDAQTMRITIRLQENQPNE